jgi:uncharacterized protein (DUF58 family)
VSDQSQIKTARKKELHLNTRLLPVWVVILIILYAVTGYRGWLVFVIGTAGAWLMAAVWVYSLRQGLAVERQLHLAWATVGDSVPEQLKVINKSWLPALWVEILDASTNLEAPVRLVSDVESRFTRTRYPNHLFKRRGLYTLGPTRLRTGDPLGIYTLTIHDQHSSTILVTPPLLPLSQLKIAPGGWAGDQRRRRGAIEWDISDAGIRDYIPGDSLRRVHWHASAHHDSLMVRLLDAATSGDWWIFVDFDSAVQAGTGQDSTLELSVILAASLAIRGLRERRRVGLALAGPELVWLEPRSDPAHRWRILRALAMAGAGNRSLSELVALGRPAQTATPIFITPTPDPEWVAVAGRFRRGGSGMALLVDPVEFGGQANQGRLVSALAQRRIPHVRIPRSLLEEAYARVNLGGRKTPGGIETARRYVQQGRADWQSMD